jgi:hypothetical protein
MRNTAACETHHEQKVEAWGEHDAFDAGQVGVADLRSETWVRSKHFLLRGKAAVATWRMKKRIIVGGGDVSGTRDGPATDA